MNSLSVPDSDDFTTKQENSTADGGIKPSSSAVTTSSWSRLKDPRIVRVSRAFGGKDRHSKVCTVRGLRDRRVRLSVPTAIQLYDLQDRLGLNQPSKVVDWLLNVAKHEIDELPPLQIPEGVVGFGENVVTSSQEMIRDDSVKEGLKMNSNELWAKSKEFSGENSDREEENWGEERQFQETQGSYFTSSSNFMSRPNLLNNNLSIPFNSFVRWDPSNLTLSQPEDSQHFSLYHQPTTSSQSYFVPSQISTTDSQLSSNFPFTSHIESTTMPLVRPFHFSMVENLFPRGDQNKDEFH